MPPPAAAPSRLTGRERVALAVVVLVIVGFGVVTELRSAFQQTRKTDFGVYARTAWAVRAGEDIYAVTDDNGWHYCYPPPFAVLMTPLADPPAGADRAGYLPFWAGVALWYVFSLGCGFYALDRFTAAALPGEPRWSRRWWYATSIPFYVCVGGIGYTLGRGQVNLQVLAFLAALFAALAANRRFTAGLWLGAAVCLKVIPAFLGLLFLLRRDGRAVAGTAAGVVVGLVLIPAPVWGVRGAVELNLRVVSGVLAPGASGGGDQTRARELTNDTATDSQSFQAVLHAWLHPDKLTRPPTAGRETRLAHWAVCGAMTLATVLVAVRRRSTGPADDLIRLGLLAVLMLLVTPVSHLHYYAFGLPLVCGLWLRGLAARPGGVSAGTGTTAVLVAWGVVTALPLLPGEWAEYLKYHGAGTAATVGLWAYGLAVLGRPAAAAAAPAAEPRRRAA